MMMSKRMEHVEQAKYQKNASEICHMEHPLDFPMEMGTEPEVQLHRSLWIEHI